MMLALVVSMWIRSNAHVDEVKKVDDLTVYNLKSECGEVLLIREYYPRRYPPTDDGSSRVRSPDGWKFKWGHRAPGDKRVIWLAFGLITGNDKYSAGWHWRVLDVGMGGFRGLDPEHQSPSRAFVVIIPYWILAGIWSVLPLYWIWKRYKTRSIRQPGRCSICGYDLRASKGRCPECGALISEQIS